MSVGGPQRQIGDHEPIAKPLAACRYCRSGSSFGIDANCTGPHRPESDSTDEEIIDVLLPVQECEECGEVIGSGNDGPDCRPRIDNDQSGRKTILAFRADLNRANTENDSLRRRLGKWQSDFESSAIECETLRADLNRANEHIATCDAVIEAAREASVCGMPDAYGHTSCCFTPLLAALDKAQQP